MFITKMSVPRRAFLRGAGVAMALPLLDAMVPALSAFSSSTARSKMRLGFIYIPNGVVMKKWMPISQGDDFEFSPTLKPLETFREHLLVLSGLAQKQAESQNQGSGDHSRASAAWLSGVNARKTEGADIQA